VLTGDINAEGKQWDPRCQVQRNAALWEDMIDGHEPEIGHDGLSTHHWTRRDQEGE